MAHGAEIPSSKRSQSVIERQKPILAKKLQEKGLQLGAPVFLRVFKEPPVLEVFVKRDNQFKLFKSYPICTFSGELGPKQKKGDLQAPEGFYFVRPRQLNPYSRFHLSFDLGYPNEYDRAHGRTGSALMIHGNCVSIGCYAMTDPAIEEIYTLLDAAFRGGQPFVRVHLFPFPLDDRALDAHRDSAWLAFWQNLKTGYDIFEKTGIPPNVTVADKQYVFDSLADTK